MDLSCGEHLLTSTGGTTGRQVDSQTAMTDRVINTDPRIIFNLLVLERAYEIHVNYFEHVQIDIQPFMRKVVTTWMLEVCEEQMCEDQVFPLSVSLMDRFLALRAISRQQLQLLAVTSMLIASKFRQCKPLSVELLCAYTDNSVAPDEVRLWETLVLQRLNWQVSSVTAFDYVEPLLARVPWGRLSPLIKRHTHTLISVCYTETEFMLIHGSLIAVACIAAAARGLGIPGSSIDSLCELTRAPVPAAEMMAKHVERVLARETCASNGREMSTPPPPQKSDSSMYSQPNTPTDIQDVQF